MYEDRSQNEGIMIGFGSICQDRVLFGSAY